MEVKKKEQVQKQKKKPYRDQSTISPTNYLHMQLICISDLHIDNITEVAGCSYSTTKSKGV